tara:strand:+ start:2088 stop:2948 length:861 start_codon:yes stop_codon:yes gene_type:complete
MAKKQKTKVEVEEPQIREEVVVEAPPVVEQPKKETLVKDIPKLKKDVWEIKPRTYLLKGNKRPLSKMIRSANIYYFDEEKGYERELKYCENQITPFVDEMKGEQRLSHVIFRNGALVVPKNKQTLQKLLSLYHPHKDKVFYELKPKVIAESQLTDINLEVDALIAARNMDIDMAEAVMRAEIGSRVSKISSKELKRDLLIFAKNNPKLLLELVSDENVMLRNFGIKATEMGILNLSSDQRTFTWASNGRKLMNVPFDEHPYSALAAWFKTDEGMEIYSNIERRLNS